MNTQCVYCDVSKDFVNILGEFQALQCQLYNAAGEVAQGTTLVRQHRFFLSAGKPAGCDPQRGGLRGEKVNTSRKNRTVNTRSTTSCSLH